MSCRDGIFDTDDVHPDQTPVNPPIDWTMRLRELLAKATPGPYIVSRNVDTGKVTLDALRADGIGEVVHRYQWSRSPSDAALDCALRNAAPALLTALDAAEALAASVEAWIGQEGEGWMAVERAARAFRAAMAGR